MILDCGHEESPHEKFTTGYGRDADGKKHCYACCAKQDLAWMRKEGRIMLYINREKGEVTNWPGSLKFKTGHIIKSWHNMAGNRYDYWFVLDGYYWHGYTIGDNTDIAHCRRTKDMFHAVKYCPLEPLNIIQG